jgi:2-oxoisovalerate dehydrogenase E1 component
VSAFAANSEVSAWLNVVRLARLAREIDRLETEELTPSGEVKLQLPAVGHEVPQILLARALTHPKDAATAYYRSRPFLLGSGLTPREALAGALGRTGSCTEGRDTGLMFNLRRRLGATVLPTSGNVGAQYTVAAGWAQAISYRARVLDDTEWDGAIAVAMGGDGSVAANGFWSALNLATTLSLPMLFFVEDNGWAISVPAALQTPGGDIGSNLAAYGNLEIVQADGSDPEGASHAILRAIAHVRGDGGPCLLRMRVPRLWGHAYRDDQAYKSAAEREEEAARDPLARLERHLLALGVDEGDLERVRSEAKSEIARALEEARSNPGPDPAEATRHVFFEGEAAPDPPVGHTPAGDGPRVNFVDAVRSALAVELERNPRMVVFGEDVGVKGGVHGATRDLQGRFGAGRVFDTSLSEEGIVGRAAGMALAGLLPVPEIQFRKYADPAHEQLSDLGTLRWRTAGRFGGGVVVRVPLGFGKRGGDPFHGMCGEAVFAHMSGWRIAFPSNAEDAVGLLRGALRGNDPTLFLEHRALLDSARARRPYPGDEFVLPFGVAAVRTLGDALTVVTWGEMVHRCLEASQHRPGRVELLDLRTLVPWDRHAVLASVRRTGRLLVVHEDTRTVGFAAEILATVATEGFSFLDAPPARLTAPDCPVPYDMGLLESVLPSTERIRETIDAMLAY